MNFRPVINKLSWTKITVILSAGIVFWTGVAEVVPDHIYKPVTVVLGALMSALTFILNAEKREG